jgi:peptidoglycan hydrolase CwlO-like protein
MFNAHPRARDKKNFNMPEHLPSVEEQMRALEEQMREQRRALEEQRRALYKEKFGEPSRCEERYTPGC